MSQHSVARCWARAAPPPASCYFDVVGDVPNSVVYTDGVQDLLVWVATSTPAMPDGASPGGSSDTSINGGPTGGSAKTRSAELWPFGGAGTGDNTSGGSDSGITGSDGGGGGLGGAPGAGGNGAGRRRQRLSRLGDQVVADARPVSSNGCAERRRRYPRGSCSPPRAAADMSFAAVGVWRSVVAAQSRLLPRRRNGGGHRMDRVLCFGHAAAGPGSTRSIGGSVAGLRGGRHVHVVDRRYSLPRADIVVVER